MDINSVFGINIPPVDSILLFATFIVLLLVIVGICLFYLKKNWDKFDGRERGYIISGIVLLPLFLIGIFYFTAITTVPHDNPSSQIPEVTIVNSHTQFYTFEYFGYLVINTTIKNSGNTTISFADVTITGYDSNGKLVLKQNRVVAGDVHPGKTASFNVTLDDPNQKVVKYQLMLYQPA